MVRIDAWLSRRTLATTTSTTMYRYEDGRAYHAYREECFGHHEGQPG